MLPRLLSGIFTAVFLPLGLAFTIVGLATGLPFAYFGIPLLVVGLACGVTFLILWRRERARRRRRRAGLRTPAEVVGVQWRPNVQVGAWLTVDLTVRFPAAGTASRTVLIPPTLRLAEGDSVEVLYDPAEPSNFEPVASAERRLFAA